MAGAAVAVAVAGIVGGSGDSGNVNADKRAPTLRVDALTIALN